MSVPARAALQVFLRRSQYPAQDIHLVFIRSCAVVEPAQAPHELTRVCGIQKPQLREGLFQVDIKPFHLVRTHRYVHAARRGRSAGEAGYPDLVTEYLYCGSEVE